MRCLPILLAAVSLVAGDVYMHNPRGSNNRLNEKSANRRNGNRMFDSQNNNRGGYNVGDKTDQAANRESLQYQMKYFESGPNAGTYLTFEWTNQHGCGGNNNEPHKTHCDVIIQYMCEDPGDKKNARDTMRDGLNTQTPQFYPGHNYESKAQFESRKARILQSNAQKGQHEPIEWYEMCYKRPRNKGLFLADQNIRHHHAGATKTRQNPNGQRRGLECPEERDYYPYWHPSPWKDIAVLTTKPERCGVYLNESYNVKPKGMCIEKYRNSEETRHWSTKNDKLHCPCADGEWTEFHNYLEKATHITKKEDCVGPKYVWGIPLFTDYHKVGKEPECLVRLPPPECKQAPWSRVNHLGNGPEGEANTYTWKLPHFLSNSPARKCVARIRYNISTDDYDPYATFSDKNKKSYTEGGITNDPKVNIGAGAPQLQLAINTAQFGRTFQDRTHVFYIQKRPAGTEAKEIHNLNVRGKRGNIVQTFPAVEYDFFPKNLTVDSDTDLVHIQWTGSNTHNNGNPAGDGQAGDAGEGRGGTDRHNILQMGKGLSDGANVNFPTPFQLSDMLDDIEIVHCDKELNCPTTFTKMDKAVLLASGGRSSVVDKNSCPASNTVCRERSVEEAGPISNTLDNAPASFAGVLVRFKTKNKLYHYLCSRNNNFTNRSQKGRIQVV